MVLLSAVQRRTDSSCVAIFESSIPHLSENVPVHFRLMPLYLLLLLTKNCSIKNLKNSGSAVLPARIAGVWDTPVLGACALHAAS